MKIGINRLESFGLMFALSVLVLVLFGATSASAATYTWDGGGDGETLSDPANWDGDNVTALTSVDQLTISSSAIITSAGGLTNINTLTVSGSVIVDISTATIAGLYQTGGIVTAQNITNVYEDHAGSLTVTGTISTLSLNDGDNASINAGTISSINVTAGATAQFSDVDGFTLNGNIDLQPNSVLTINSSILVGGASGNTNDGSLVLPGVISGSGSLTKQGAGSWTLSGNNVAYAGNIAVNAGEVIVTHASGLGTSAGTTTVASGATLKLDLTGDGLSIGEPFSLSGSGLTDRQTLEVTKGSGGTSEVTLTGTIALGSGDVEVGSDRAVVLSGVISGSGGALTYVDKSTDSTGTLKLTGTNTYDGATTVSDTMIVTGTQSSSAITVASGGTLKGTGTVGVLTVSAGGHLAPGLSPGCLISGNTSIAGNFDVELGGTTACTEYDQLQVTGTVDVTSGTLNVSRFGGFTPAVGQTFTIISNDVADAVTGTFAGLAQGATITVDGYTFTISYTGGDGNDVVLTVTGVPAAATPPAAPNTGFGLIMANPLLTLALTTGAAAALFAASRRYGLITIANRK